MGKKITTMSLSEDVIKEGKKQAKKRNRTLSNYVECLIIEDGKKQVND